MSHAWSGADPTQSGDSGSYSLGATFVANVAITVTGIRVWEGASPGTLGTRNGRLWTTGESQLAIASMPSTLPSGWSEYSFTAPVNLTANQQATIAYDTGGFYGALVGAFDASVTSADNAVTFLAGASAPHGNGSFTSSVGGYPDVASSNHAFYGVDIVYSITGGTTPPTIAGMTAVAVGETVTSTINAVGGSAGLANAVYAWNWGDGTTTSGSSSAATHTYATPGLYAILGSVTDTAGLSADAARPVMIVAVASGFDPNGITSALTSLAQQTGNYVAVAGHEPASLPAAGMSAAVWVQGIQPVKRISGLSETAARIEYRMRIYMPMITGDMDSIDPQMTAAAVEMIGLLSANFTLGGDAFAVDLLGLSGGAPLGAKADYYKQGDSFYRIYDITIPVIADDVWTQGAVS